MHSGNFALTLVHLHANFSNTFAGNPSMLAKKNNWVIHQKKLLLSLCTAPYTNYEPTPIPNMCNSRVYFLFWYLSPGFNNQQQNDDKDADYNHFPKTAFVAITVQNDICIQSTVFNTCMS